MFEETESVNPESHFEHGEAEISFFGGIGGLEKRDSEKELNRQSGEQ